MEKIDYDGYRFPPAIIQQAIWLYFRFTLSFRDVEDLLGACPSSGGIFGTNLIPFAA
jgi:transposase-like protein